MLSRSFHMIIISINMIIMVLFLFFFLIFFVAVVVVVCIIKMKQSNVSDFSLTLGEEKIAVS